VLLIAPTLILLHTFSSTGFTIHGSCYSSSSCSSGLPHSVSRICLEDLPVSRPSTVMGLGGTCSFELSPV